MASTTSKFAAKSTAAPKAKVKKTVTRTPLTETPLSRFEQMQSDFAELGITLPSSTRTMISLVATFLTSFATMYVCVSAVEWMMVGAMLYTGSAFIAFMVLATGYALSLYVAWKAALAVGRFVLGFNVDDVRSTASSVKDAAQRKVSLVRGWFTRDAQPQVA